MLFVVPVVLFDMLKAKQLACVSESGQKCPAAQSLSLRRAWIEIGSKTGTTVRNTCRSPYGERGLKYVLVDSQTLPHLSLSLRRAWIEMYPVGSAAFMALSLSLRRAWIEIAGGERTQGVANVALLTESVD